MRKKYTNARSGYLYEYKLFQSCVTTLFNFISVALMFSMLV